MRKGTIILWLPIVLLTACSSTETRTCVWTDTTGQQQSVTATRSTSTEVDAATIAELASLARAAARGAVTGGIGIAQAQPMVPMAAPSPTLPEVCARMFGVDQ